MNYSKDFSERILDLEITFQQLGKTQKDLADSLGVSTRTIRRWKNGVTKPRGKDRVREVRTKVQRRERYYLPKTKRIGKSVGTLMDRNVLAFDMGRAVDEDWEPEQRAKLEKWIKDNEIILIPAEVYLVESETHVVVALVIYTENIDSLEGFTKAINDKTRALLKWIYKHYKGQTPVIEYGAMHVMDFKTVEPVKYDHFL